MYLLPLKSQIFISPFVFRISELPTLHFLQSELENFQKQTNESGSQERKESSTTVSMTNKYEKLEKLNESKYCKVYIGKHRETGKVVAIKADETSLWRL